MYESSVDTETIRQLIDVSRVWLGVDEGRRVVQLRLLDENLVLEALKQGSVAKCGDWTINVTQPRGIPPLGEEREWTPGILAMSAHGFATGLCIDAESVHHVCKQIREMEQRRAARLEEELETENDKQREFDEG